MAKPLLLSAGQGKVQEFVGTSPGQVATWSETAGEWFAGPSVGGSGGGGRIYYLNENTAPESPTTGIPTSSNGLVTVKQLGTLADAAQTTVTTTAMSTNPASPTILAGFVTATGDPDRTSIPAGLWEFNVWASASGPSIKPDDVLLRVGVYKYNGSTAPTLIANSDYVGIFNTTTTSQYTATVLIPAGVTLADTDRIYVQIDTYSTSINHDLTCLFGNGTPSHVHTTIPVLVNLATDVTGILPTDNGGTGKGTSSPPAINTVFAGAASGGAALPTFRALVYDDIKTLIPYDLPCEIPGVPSVSTKVVSFIAVRPYRIASSGHRGGCAEANPTSNTNFTVYKGGSSIGTITFNSDGTFSSSITQTDFAINDVLSVDTGVAVNGMDTPFFTFFMTLL